MRGALAACVLACAASGAVGARAADEPLSFGFLDERPGELFTIGTTRLHLHCRGRAASATGGATVVFESGLGGSSLEWSPIAEALARRARACTYDRAGYGWSDPSPGRRDARRLARELSSLLAAGGVDGPLILVAHSFGGLVARLFAEHREDVAGLLLLDSSHEEQFERLETEGERPLGPRNRQFVISANEPPESLPRDIRRKVAAFSRMRKTYSATHGEMASFRESAEQVRRARRGTRAPYAFPVTVIRRGRDVYAGRAAGAARTATWIELQEDLARLGVPGRLVVAEGSGHHVHADDPALVIAEIGRLLALVDGVPLDPEIAPESAPGSAPGPRSAPSADERDAAGEGTEDGTSDGAGR